MRFGGLEILAILAIICLIFGPKQIPKLTNAIKGSIASFKEGKDGKKEEQQTEEQAQPDSTTK